MCSVTKQRRDVGWLVLVDDDLSTESARRRLNEGVATGCRQTVETATRHDGTVSEPCRQRPVNGDSRQRVDSDGVTTGSEMTPRRCTVAERQRRGWFSPGCQFSNDRASATFFASPKNSENSLVDCF